MNEWGFAGEIKSWWDDLIGRTPEWGLGRVTIEETPEGESGRADITLYDSMGHQLLVLELRLPDHTDASPASMANIHNAMTKAVAVGARWSATSDGEDFRLLDHSRHDVPLRERAVPVAPLRSPATRRSLDVPGSYRLIREAWHELLTRLAPLLVGREEAPTVAPDEFFVDSLHASLARPFAETRDSIIERQLADLNFSDELVKWMVDKQGWLHDPKEFQAEITRISQVVTYVFATRLLFYGALRRAQPDLPVFELPKSGNAALTQNSVQSLFAQARKVTGDYETVFVFDEVCQWALISQGSCLGWLHVLELLEHFQLESIGFDVLGRLFERLIDPHERYEWGQHYTSPDVVDLMLSAALPEGTGTVYDPASGGGTFLVRAYSRKRAFVPGSTHNERLREIAGGDVSAFAASVSTISLASQNLAAGSNYPQVRVGSFFGVRPGETFVSLPDGAGGYEERQLSSISAVVCNPPYIGFSNIGDRAKEALATYAEEWPARPALGHKYNYHLFFWFHAAKFLRYSGRMAFITSGEWLDSDYGVQLQEWLTANFHIELVIESMAEQWFGEARVGTVVLVARKLNWQESTDGMATRFVTLRRPLALLYGHDATDDTLRLLSVDSFRDRMLELQGRGESDDLDHHTVMQNDLRDLGGDPEGRYVGLPWRSRYLRSPQIAHVMNVRADYVELGSIASVQLGAKTGADKFFFLKIEKPLRGGKSEVRGINGWIGTIGNSHLQATLQNPKDLDVGDGRRFIVRAKSLPGRYFSPAKVIRDSGVRSYIQAGEDAQIHEQRLVKANSDEVWYRQNRTIVCAPWALPYNSALDYFAVDNTEARAVLNGRFIGVTPSQGVDVHLLGAVLNSTLTILARLLVGVATGNEGAYDVGPPAARLMRVPDPTKFCESGKVKVLRALRQIREADRIPAAPDGSGSVDPLRRELDSSILVALGETPGSAAVVLDRLYASYARWRTAVENVESQVRSNRRALGARGGNRMQDPIKRAIKVVHDEIGSFHEAILARLASLEPIEFIDADAPETDVQDALIEMTSVKVRGGSPVDLGFKSRVDFVGELRHMGWSGKIPIPDEHASSEFVQRLKIGRKTVEAAALKRAAAYVGNNQVSEVAAGVVKQWSADQVSALRSALAELKPADHGDTYEPSNEPSLFETEGLVPPLPKTRKVDQAV